MASIPRSAEPPFEATTTRDQTQAKTPFLKTLPASAPTFLDEPLQTRLEFYAYFLGCNEERSNALFSANAIPTALYPLCLVLRYLITKEHIRLGESSKRFNWSLRQLHAAIASGYRAYQTYLHLKADPSATTLPANLNYEEPTLPPTTKDIHLQSSLQLTLQSAHMLAQSLLLCPEPFSVPPSSLVLGSMFHHLAQSTQPDTRESIVADASETEKAILGWILHDTEDWLAIDVEALRKAKRERKKQEKKSQDTAKAQKVAQEIARKKAGAFSLLQLDTEDGDDEDQDNSNSNEEDEDEDEA